MSTVLFTALSITWEPDAVVVTFSYGSDSFLEGLPQPKKPRTQGKQTGMAPSSLSLALLAAEGLMALRNG